MILQRLMRDNTSGFKYVDSDKSDISNYARANGCDAIARAFIDGNITAKATLFAEYPSDEKHNELIEVIILSTFDYIENGSESSVYTVKSQTEHLSDEVVAWMHVGEDRNITPCIIVRSDLDDSQNRINLFFKDSIIRLKMNQFILDGTDNNM